MKEQTAKILNGFINEMIKDLVGWDHKEIGRQAYHLFRLIENFDDIPEDKVKK